MTEKNITLPLNLVNGILEYLGTKPYGEVYKLVQVIQHTAAPQLEEQTVQVVGGTDLEVKINSNQD